MFKVMSSIIEKLNKTRIYNDGHIEKIIEYKVQNKDKDNSLWNDFMQIALSF